MLTKLSASMLFCCIIHFSVIYLVVTSVENNKFRKVDFFEGRFLLEAVTTGAHSCLTVCVQHNAACQAVRYNTGGQLCHLLDKWSTVNVTSFLSDENWLTYVVAVCK